MKQQIAIFDSKYKIMSTKISKCNFCYLKHVFSASNLHSFNIVTLVGTNQNDHQKCEYARFDRMNVS